MSATRCYLPRRTRTNRSSLSRLFSYLFTFSFFFPLLLSFFAPFLPPFFHSLRHQLLLLYCTQCSSTKTVNIHAILPSHSLARGHQPDYHLILLLTPSRFKINSVTSIFPQRRHKQCKEESGGKRRVRKKSSGKGKVRATPFTSPLKHFFIPLRLSSSLM